MKQIKSCPALFPLLLLTIFSLGLAGCETTKYDPINKQTGHANPPTGKTNQVAKAVEPSHDEALILRDGDVLSITFPGSPNLNTSQTIRRDGKITLQLAGEITAEGMTPPELEKEIAKAYGSQLISKELTVTVVSSSIPVYVTGAVLSPHKVISDHPISVLEAIMEAGGFDYTRANTKDVRVIRYKDGREHTYVLNMKSVLQGKQSEPFYLDPFDIIYVPERFSIF